MTHQFQQHPRRIRPTLANEMSHYLAQGTLIAVVCMVPLVVVGLVGWLLFALARGLRLRGRLVEAAPDLLAACKAMIDPDRECDGSDISLVMAAINKAEVRHQ